MIRENLDQSQLFLVSEEKAKIKETISDLKQKPESDKDYSLKLEIVEIS